MITYSFVLYVAGTGERSTTALTNLRLMCRTHIPDRFEIEVVDAVGQPELADEARIFATPTVVRVTPPPHRKVIGDLSDIDRAAAALGLPDHRAGGAGAGKARRHDGRQHCEGPYDQE